MGLSRLQVALCRYAYRHIVRGDRHSVASEVAALASIPVAALPHELQP
jgi:hypothetical protein